MHVLYSIGVFLFILLVSPVILLISVIVFLFSGAPVFYTQKRIGYQGKPFIMYKFRTMIHGAETLQGRYKNRNEVKGPVFKIHNDPRFTAVGKFLSHTGLDELPQLWNVLIGDMAFFGPRPLPVLEASKLKPWQKKRQCIKPGILSPWVLHGYHTRTFNEWMTDDITYVQKKRFWYDVQLFFCSLVFMVKLFVREIRNGVLMLSR